LRSADKRKRVSRLLSSANLYFDDHAALPSDFDHVVKHLTLPSGSQTRYDHCERPGSDLFFFPHAVASVTAARKLGLYQTLLQASKSLADGSSQF
jgi:hypothetical protein